MDDVGVVTGTLSLVGVGGGYCGAWLWRLLLHAIQCGGMACMCWLLVVGASSSTVVSRETASATASARLQTRKSVSCP